MKAGFFSADALEISGGLICLVIGSAFHIAGGWFHIAGFTFDFLVVLCGLTIITHHVENFNLFGFRYWLSLVVALIIFVSLAFYVVRKETANPLPPTATESKPVEAPESLGVVEPEPAVTLESLGVVARWHPPELSNGCQMVWVHLGGSTVGCPPIDLPNHPITSSNIMHIFAFPGEFPIVPYIKDNRFYIAVKSLIRTSLDTMFMSEDLNYPLPEGWDRNYDSDSYEIVAEDGLPVLQIKYLQPNEVQVNGIFFISKSYGLIAFGDGFETRPLPIEKNDELLSEREAWFQYPSGSHLHELESARPIKERLTKRLNSLSPQILAALQAGKSEFIVLMTKYQSDELQKLGGEPDANAYIRIVSDTPTNMVLHQVIFTLSPDLLK